jgi:diguanylate cyclase (GGDEF)-like protein/PAS domain S-box-containing protein
MFQKLMVDIRILGSMLANPHLINRAQGSEINYRRKAKYSRPDSSADQGVVYLDVTGAVVFINSIAANILGLPLESMKGQKLVDRSSKVIKEDGSLLPFEQHPVRLAFDTGKPVENRVIGLFNPEKQSYIWVLTTSIPEFRAHELHPCQVVMTFTDITHQKQPDVRLTTAPVIVKDMGEAIVITDEDKKIMSVNGMFTALTGFMQKEVLGKRADFLQAGRKGIKIDDISICIGKGSEWQGELWYRRKGEDEEFPSWTAVSGVKDSKGSIIHYVYVFIDITHLRKDQDYLDFLAYHDSLTQLPNRMLLQDRINHSLKNAQRDNTRIAILFLDLDRFKLVNDTYGHAAGDELLKEVALRIKNLVRSEDTVSRYAGDEFIVLMEGVSDRRSPAKLAQKLINAFSLPFHIQESSLHVSTSVGISLFPENGLDADTLIKNADEAMYLAKKEGRNNFQYYNSELTTEASEKIALENSLRQSISNNELVLYYQPQVCLKTGKLVAVESLVYWNHPTRGLLSPLEFISLAEKIGFMPALGEWMLQTVCRQMRQWLDENVPVAKITIKVSSAQILRANFVGSVHDALRTYGLKPDCIEIEISECQLADNSELIISVLNQLVASGIDVIIDDFGAHCFSLNNLKRIPVKKLKISNSLVLDKDGNANEADVIRLVIALAHNLHLQVIAEGIESETQQKLLLDIGCDEGQGYLYSPPRLPDSDIFRQLAS